MTSDARAGEPGTGDWPHACEVCGSELQAVQLEFVESDFSEGRQGTPVSRDVCPNPECPRHVAEAGGDSGGATPTRDSLPGSLGGDNGGG